MTELSSKIRSPALGNERTVWIRKPATPYPRTPIVVFLDAELYRDRVGAPEVIDSLRGTVADAWYVYVSMESVEARWRECACHPPFAAFLADELLPWLRSQFRVSETPMTRTLIGLSYTGLAAAFVAKEKPGIFQKIICQSGSFWWNDCSIVRKYDQASSPVPSEFYLDVGLKETAENVRHREDVLQVVSQIEGVRSFRDVLTRKGSTVRYVEFDGGHDAEAWRRALPNALKWALANGI